MTSRRVQAQLAKVCRDAAKVAVEQVKGLSCQARRLLHSHRKLQGVVGPWWSPSLPGGC